MGPGGFKSSVTNCNYSLSLKQSLKEQEGGGQTGALHPSRIPREMLRATEPGRCRAGAGPGPTPLAGRRGERGQWPRYQPADAPRAPAASLEPAPFEASRGRSPVGKYGSPPQPRSRPAAGPGRPRAAPYPSARPLPDGTGLTDAGLPGRAAPSPTLFSPRLAARPPPWPRRRSSLPPQLFTVSSAPSPPLAPCRLCPWLQLGWAAALIRTAERASRLLHVAGCPAGLPHTPRAALAPLAARTETEPGYATAGGGEGDGAGGGHRGGIIWDGSRAGPSRAERLRPSGGGRPQSPLPPVAVVAGVPCPVARSAVLRPPVNKRGCEFNIKETVSNSRGAAPLCPRCPRASRSRRCCLRRVRAAGARGARSPQGRWRASVGLAVSLRLSGTQKVKKNKN